MNSEHFIRFVKSFQAFDYAKDNMPETTISMYGDDRIKEIDPEALNFRNHIKTSISKCKVFEIDDETKKLLCLTETPLKNDEVKLPFEYLFLDVQFTKEELEDLGIEISAKEITGIMASEGILTNGEINVGKDLRITMLSVIENDEVWFDTFNKNFNLEEEYKDFHFQVKENPTTDKKAREFVHKFFLNFINFLNNPEVEYVEHKRSEKNIQRRLKQGRPVIPSSMTIRVNGKLKQYIDNLKSGEQFHFNYRFFVRGHFRNLSSNRYKTKKRIWILPFIKGEGVLIDKSYKVIKKGENG